MAANFQPGDWVRTRNPRYAPFTHNSISVLGTVLSRDARGWCTVRALGADATGTYKTWEATYHAVNLERYEPTEDELYTWMLAELEQ